MLAGIDRRLGAPILAYPAVSLAGRNLSEILSSPDMQADAVSEIAKRAKTGAAFCFMDLSVEAEAFGARAVFSENSVPHIDKSLLKHPSGEKSLKIPSVGAGRTGIYLNGAILASERISDRPTYACVCGPYTVAWQLWGAENLRALCLKEPKEAEILLEKIWEFQVEYVDAYKRGGLSGVLIAEPLAGFLPKELNWRFSGKYVKRIVEREQSSDFSVIYHSCADCAEDIIGQILRTQACAFHFGEMSDIGKILSRAPKDILIMGNLRALDFVEKSPGDIALSTRGLLEKFGMFENYAISSGCDIPLNALWENIDAFCGAVRQYYK